MYLSVILCKYLPLCKAFANFLPKICIVYSSTEFFLTYSAVICKLIGEDSCLSRSLSFFNNFDHMI